MKLGIESISLLYMFARLACVSVRGPYDKHSPGVLIADSISRAGQHATSLANAPQTCIGCYRCLPDMRRNRPREDGVAFMITWIARPTMEELDIRR